MRGGRGVTTWLWPDKGWCEGGGRGGLRLSWPLWAIRIDQLTLVGNYHWLAPNPLSLSLKHCCEVHWMVNMCHSEFHIKSQIARIIVCILSQLAVCSICYKQQLHISAAGFLCVQRRFQQGRINHCQLDIWNTSVCCYVHITTIIDKRRLDIRWLYKALFGLREGKRKSFQRVVTTMIIVFYENLT